MRMQGGGFPLGAAGISLWSVLEHDPIPSESNEKVWFIWAVWGENWAFLLSLHHLQNRGHQMNSFPEWCRRGCTQVLLFLPPQGVMPKVEIYLKVFKQSCEGKFLQKLVKIKMQKNCLQESRKSLSYSQQELQASATGGVTLVCLRLLLSVSAPGHLWRRTPAELNICSTISILRESKIEAENLLQNCPWYFNRKEK